MLSGAGIDILFITHEVATLSIDALDFDFFSCCRLQEITPINKSNQKTFLVFIIICTVYFI